MSSDEILEYLVKKAEETGIGTAVQLCINGLIVTGSLINPNRYYDLMHSIFDYTKGILTDDPLEIKLMSSYKESYKEYIKEKRKQNKREDNSKYVYLKNVVFYPTASSTTTVIAECWRGKLSCVDGLSIGGTPLWAKKLDDK
jgi:hypothetical protein